LPILFLSAHNPKFRCNFEPFNKLIFLNIFLGYPWWFIVFCILAGSVYAILLYFKSKPFESPFKWANLAVPVVRGTLVFLLAFLLLKPLMKYSFFRTEKPLIVLALDKSISMISPKNAPDSNLMVQEINNFKEKLKNDFELDLVEFGQTTSPVSKFTPDFSKLGTNISSVVNYTTSQRSRNLASAVIISDGIYNEGLNPLNLANEQKVPFYTVGVGDTSVVKDLMVKQVFSNSITFLGSKFPVKVELKAEKLNGKSSVLEVVNNGIVVFSKQIVINSDSYYEEHDFTLLADKAGYQSFLVRVKQIEGETYLANNISQFFIEVLDARKKIALVSNFPHPDIGSIQNALASFDNLEVKVQIGDYVSAEMVDLVILYGSFKNQGDLNFIQQLHQKNIPILHIMDGQFRVDIFNQNKYGLTYSPEGSGMISGLPVWNSNFDFFEISNELRETLRNWSPLNMSYGKINGFTPSQVMLYQQIGSVLTEQPLILLGKKDDMRYGIVNGSGFWRWRLLTFEKDGNHTAHQEFWSKIVQFLSVKQDNKRLRVVSNKKLYNAGESVILQGELLNKNMEPVTSSEVKVNLEQKTEGKEKQFSYLMNTQDKGYVLRLSNLGAGAYNFTASATIGGEKFTDKGAFSITGVQKELSSLVADHTILANFAIQTGGDFYTLKQLDQLADDLLKRDDFKELIIQENKMKELIDWQWLFWVILALLTFEWFIRKLSIGT